jgi:hypothetical protein
MILESNIQKERPLNGDLSSVNQVFNMITIMSGIFNTNCYVVDCLTAHILSYPVADLVLSVPLLFAAFSEKNNFLEESPKKVVTWV